MNHYTAVYTMIFAVMFNVMVARSQQLGAFTINKWTELVKLTSAVLMIVLLPILFFVFALPVVAKFPNAMDTPHLLTILYWVTPVYGFQQAWLLFAKPQKWVKAEEVLISSAVWWVLALSVFGLGPVLRLIYDKCAQSG